MKNGLTMKEPANTARIRSRKRRMVAPRSASTAARRSGPERSSRGGSGRRNTEKVAMTPAATPTARMTVNTASGDSRSRTRPISRPVTMITAWMMSCMRDMNRPRSCGVVRWPMTGCMPAMPAPRARLKPSTPMNSSATATVVRPAPANSATTSSGAAMMERALQNRPMERTLPSRVTNSRPMSGMNWDSGMTANNTPIITLPSPTRSPNRVIRLPERHWNEQTLNRVKMWKVRCAAIRCAGLSARRSGGRSAVLTGRR